MNHSKVQGITPSKFAPLPSSDAKSSIFCNPLTDGTCFLCSGDLLKANQALILGLKNCSPKSIEYIILLANQARTWLSMAPYFQMSKQYDSFIFDSKEQLTKAAKLFKALDEDTQLAHDTVGTNIQTLLKMIEQNDFASLATPKTQVTQIKA